MTKEEAKHLSEVLKAYSEGKSIQVKDKIGNNVWYDMITNYEVLDIHNKYYRIRPEKKYRPYANAEEFLKAQKEHGMYLKFNEYYHLPLELSDKSVVIKYVEYTYSLLLQDFRFQDGTLCGILEE